MAVRLVVVFSYKDNILKGRINRKTTVWRCFPERRQGILLASRSSSHLFNFLSIIVFILYPQMKKAVVIYPASEEYVAGFFYDGDT